MHHYRYSCQYCQLGDAREPVRARVQQIVQSLPKVYAFSRVFQILLEQGLKSKVAKTRQGTLDEIAGVLKRFGIGACEPGKAFPVIATAISDKDPNVRKSSLAALSEGYVLVGEKIWQMVGPLSPKDKTQLEERLRRVAGPSTPDKGEAPAPVAQVSRLATLGPRSNSPAPSIASRIGGIPRPSSPAVGPTSRLARPLSPSYAPRSISPAPTSSLKQPSSPGKATKTFPSSHLPGPSGITSPSGIGKPKSLLPSRLGPPRSRVPEPHHPPPVETIERHPPPDAFDEPHTNGNGHMPHHPDHDFEEPAPQRSPDDVTVAISSILSNDPSRSVEALKKIQRVLQLGPDAGPSSPAYRELAEHTEGLIETITLQMAHVFERPDDVAQSENFRLAKHLIQTLNAFCDHVFLAESLTVDILTALLEELTLRLLQTDNSPDPRVKDLSRFINMIILRLFATGRKMSVFR